MNPTLEQHEWLQDRALGDYLLCSERMGQSPSPCPEEMLRLRNRQRMLGSIRDKSQECLKEAQKRLANPNIQKGFTKGQLELIAQAFYVSMPFGPQETVNGIREEALRQLGEMG